ncbi:MAG: HAD-IA family hydrolase [Acidimicrobiales bacterium]
MAAGEAQAAAWHERDRSALGNPETGIRAVLFDFGGVLSESPFTAFARYEAENRLPPGFLRTVNATDHDANAWARLERGEVTLDEFGALFEAEARAAGHNVDASGVLALLGGAPRPAMIAAVRRARQRYLVALATNNYVSVHSEHDRGGVSGVLELFDEVIESYRLGMRKPEPAFFEYCCDRLGIAPHEAVFIDDLGINLKPARRLGMTTIKFVTEEQALEDLEAALRMPSR